mmetsp:Transcript_1790/g.2493  ORF Transcript_1790/g.2493 Transcript_1790/m.2493 type:complete len:119 (+) Transcript_1790:73-429(+)
MTIFIVLFIIATLGSGGVQGFIRCTVSPFLSTRNLNMVEKTPLVTSTGKRLEVDGGSSLMAACLKLGLKVPTNCKKGECGVCTVTIAGQKIRSCVGKVPPPPKLKSLKEKGLIITVDN